MAEIARNEAGARLIIDLGAIAANYSLLRERAGSAVCAPVVKADAYGLGAAEVVPALLGAGADTFFVAQLSEAREVRALAPEAVIYVLNGLAPDTAAETIALGARPVLCAPEEIAEWAAFCKASGKRHAAAVQVDTGMNRLGLSPAEARALAEDGAGLVKSFELALLMSHFVSSELPDETINARQIAAFEEIRALFPGAPASMANSSGIFLPQEPYFDLVRPGYALYGGNPRPGRANPMQPVVLLEARIGRIREVEAGESAGYNATWVAKRRSRLAIACLGYADGLPWALGNGGGAVVIAGQRCPIVGRVSMDLVIIDITDLPQGAVARGDFATLIGDGIVIEDLASASGTIGYDILTGLGRRFARSYVNVAVQPAAAQKAG